MGSIPTGSTNLKGVSNADRRKKEIRIYQGRIQEGRGCREADRKENEGGKASGKEEEIEKGG